MNTINSLVGNDRLGFEDAYWTTGSGFMNDIYTTIRRRAGEKNHVVGGVRGHYSFMDRQACFWFTDCFVQLDKATLDV